MSGALAPQDAVHCRSSRGDTMVAHTDVDAIRAYWNARPLGTQYINRDDVEVGTREFYEHIRPWMNPFKFPWIMERIDREARLLQGKHLLEVGCGMGFDSLQFLERGVRVTATDLTPAAVDLTRRHFDIAGYRAAEVRVANALALGFDDETFDAVWANGVLHHTGDTERAIQETRRVLKPGGRCIVSHFYRKNSWMYWVNRLGRENIEHKEEDPPVTEFYRDCDVERMFRGFDIVETSRDHHRLLPVCRTGLKAALYTHGLRPVYNLMPDRLARALAYKLSVTAIKK